uniref:Uncharacterized protein n=1 Tax=Salmonella sp. TaxID=599 RepID=A0A482ETY3_SALSP|nr:hypothetical protein NNIBIDOC_00200 [Salmonella sp.]
MPPARLTVVALIMPISCSGICSALAIIRRSFWCLKLSSNKDDLLTVLQTFTKIFDQRGILRRDGVRYLLHINAGDAMTFSISASSSMLARISTCVGCSPKAVFTTLLVRVLTSPPAPSSSASSTSSATLPPATFGWQRHRQ